MNNPFKLLSKKFRVNARPKIGATLTLTALNKKQPTLVWRNLILTGVPWLLICFVLLVAWLSNQPNPAFSMTRIYITLGLYGLYVLMLEVTSRLFKEQYESTWFRIGRIVVNYLIVTALVLLSPRAGSYFWFFYSLPILQSIVFFRARGVLLVGVSSLTTYWGVIIFARNYLHEPGNPVSVLVNSLVLTLTSFALYWLFHSAKENQAENIALSAKTQRSLIRLETLNQINGQINTALTLKEILQIALIDGLRGVRTTEGSIMFVQPITGELAINAWIVAGQFKQDKTHRTLASKEGIAGYVATTGKAYNCPDTSCDRRFVSSLTGRRPRSLLCVPIVAQGPVLGVINADHPMPNFFEQEDVEFLSALAGNLAIAIEKKELYDKVLAERDRSAWMATMLLDLQTATTKMQSELELSALLNLVAEQAAKLLNADSGGVLLLDAKKDSLRIHGSYGLKDKTIKETCDDLGMSIAGRVVAQQKAIIALDIPHHPWFHNPVAGEEGFLAIISTPMWIQGQIIGTLDIHSKTKTDAFTNDDLTILSLMARHAEVAIEKAQLFEQEHGQNQAYELVNRVFEAVAQSKQPSRLDALLHAVNQEIQQSIVNTNLLVMLKDNHGNWLYNGLQPTNGEAYRARWRRLVLPLDVKTYCRQYGLRPVGNEPAQSWMSEPMVVGGLIVGALGIENDHQKNAFTKTDRELFQRIAEQLAGIIYAAWIEEKRIELYDQLTMLQSAGETIMLLAEQDEAWLWKTTLTLATAHYGLRFERAVLFLTEKDDKSVRGRMGIGHFDKALAIQDWVKDEVGGMTFERYLHLLRTGKLSPTPVESFVAGWQIELAPTDNVFARVLQKGEIEQVAADEAQLRFPSMFIEKFGVYDYSVVPIKAGKRVIGLVILSNPFKSEPHRYEALVYFETLLSQAALVYENLHYRQVQKQLIDVNHTILVKANTQSLSETLTQVCQAAQTVTEADLIAIYPLYEEANGLQYDFENGGWAGHRRELRLAREHGQGSFTLSILDSGSLQVIPDVTQHRQVYNGVPLSEHQFIMEEGIRALIAVPIYEPKTKARSGILYLNSRYVRDFTEQDTQLAESLAQLAAVAIRNWQDAKGLRAEKKAREEELAVLGQVLREALTYGIDEKILIESLLRKISELLKPLPVNIGILLKEWQRAPQPRVEPIEIRRQYFWDGHDLSESIEKDIYRGISGRALKMGLIQNVANTRVSEWGKLFYADDNGTQSELDVPIQLGEQIIGVFNLESPQINAFQPQHVAALTRFASAAALALDNVRRQQNLHTLLRAASVVHGPTKLDETLKAIAQEIQQAIPVLSTLIIWHKDLEHGKLILGEFFGVLNEEALKREIPAQNGLVRLVMDSLKPIEASDVQNHPWFKNREFIQREKLRSTIAFPLRVENEVIGVMFFSYRKRHEFTTEERTLFPLLAEFVATSVNDAVRLRQTEQQKRRAEQEERRLDAALKITESVSATMALDETLSQILGVLAKLYPKTTPRIMLYNQATDRLDFVLNMHAQYEIDNPIYADLTSLPVDDSSLAGYLAIRSLEEGEKKLSYVANVHNAPVYLPLRLDTKSAVGVTLMSSDGEAGKRKLLGVLLLESTEQNGFHEEDHEVILGIARQTRITIERVRHSADLRFHSTVIGATSWMTPIIHDINRETGRIRRRIARLHTEPHLSSKGSRRLDEIDQLVSRLANIVAETSPGQEEMQPLDIEKEVKTWVESTVQERSVDLKVEFCLQTNGTLVLAHPRALRRAIHDLTRNALEAMGWKPEQRLTIRTSLTRDERYVELSIEDNGPGIEPQMQLKLFNEPVSTKGDGRGCGLLFVRAALEQMNGRVHFCASTKTNGAIFVLSMQVLEESHTTVNTQEVYNVNRTM